jgi:hypothetical protein
MARLGDWSHPGQLKPPLGHLLIPTRKIIIEFGHMGDEKSWKPLWKPGDLKYFRSKIFLRSNIYKTELIFPLFLAVSIKLPHIISPWWKIDPWEESQIELELALTKPMPTCTNVKLQKDLSLPRHRLVASTCLDSRPHSATAGCTLTGSSCQWSASPVGQLGISFGLWPSDLPSLCWSDQVNVTQWQTYSILRVCKVTPSVIFIIMLPK